MAEEDPFDFDIARARLAAFFARALEDKSPDDRVGDFWDLFNDGTGEQRMRAWRRIRDAGLLPASAAAFMLDLAAESISEPRAYALPEYQALDARRLALEREAGFTDGCDADALADWVEDGSPPEYHECWNSMERLEVWERVAALREFGERELADLLEHRPRDFSRLRARGRAFFLPPLPPSAYDRRARLE
jgi:hypothetical protein